MFKRFIKWSLLCGFLLAQPTLTLAADASFTPSIQELASSEILVVNIKACHWGCQKGVIEIEGIEARTKYKSLKLLPSEIAQLDDYFSRGNDNSYCSLPIEIDFKKRVGFKVHAKKGVQIYPCSFGEGTKLDTLDLLYFLNESPHETPIWRLSKTERDKRNSLTHKRN